MNQCKCLEEVQKLAKWPFHKPIVLSTKALTIEVGGWAVSLFKETPSGRISSKSAGTLYLNFCPMCGEQLRELQDATE